ncbi:MAG: acyl-CoA dehydrogenase family protein, partial [Dehalococcoidia bacterium]
MHEWSETELMIRDAVRQFVDNEIRPHVDDLEYGGLPPYDIIRKFFSSFGVDAMARENFKKQLERAKAREAGEPRADKSGGISGQEAMALLAVSEICKVSMGITAAMGVSVGLAANTIMARGTPAQQERWALDLLTFEKVGAWAITEPDAGSDAFGGMRTTVKP